MRRGWRRSGTRLGSCIPGPRKCQHRLSGMDAMRQCQSGRCRIRSAAADLPVAPDDLASHGVCGGRSQVGLVDCVVAKAVLVQPRQRACPRGRRTDRCSRRRWRPDQTGVFPGKGQQMPTAHMPLGVSPGAPARPGNPQECGRTRTQAQPRFGDTSGPAPVPARWGVPATKTPCRERPRGRGDCGGGLSRRRPRVGIVVLVSPHAQSRTSSATSDV